MKRKLLRGLLGITALATLCSLFIPVFTFCGPSAVIARATSETNQVGLAVKLYANDHQGRLPESLNELVPHYLQDKSLLLHVNLATPHAVLGELPPETIILFRVAMDGWRGETCVLEVHPDFRVESKLP